MSAGAAPQQPPQPKTKPEGKSMFDTSAIRNLETALREENDRASTQADEAIECSQKIMRNSAASSDSKKFRVPTPTGRFKTRKK